MSLEFRSEMASRAESSSLSVSYGLDSACSVGNPELRSLESLGVPHWIMLLCLPGRAGYCGRAGLSPVDCKIRKMQIGQVKSVEKPPDSI